MRRGKAVWALALLSGAAALGLGGRMAAKRQPSPLPARYALREAGAGPWFRDQGNQNTCWALAPGSRRLPVEIILFPGLTF